VSVDGVIQPGPAPRFSATPCDPPVAPEAAGASTEAALRDWGIAPDCIQALLASGAVGARALSDKV
jgi:alpha-methylacyl-CoA racemase